MLHYKLRFIAALGAVTLISSPCLGQEQRPGRVSESMVGEVGQRQTGDQTQSNIKPMARINNRISNRVQNRIRNRIDRYYDPQSNVTAPFEVAAEQAQRSR